MRTLIACVPLIAVAIVAALLHRKHAGRIARRELSVTRAIAGYAVVLLLVAAALSLLAIDYAHWALGSFPNFGPPAISVSTAYAIYVGGLLAPVFALLAILVSGWRFVVIGRRLPDAPQG